MLIEFYTNRDKYFKRALRHAVRILGRLPEPDKIAKSLLTGAKVRLTFIEGVRLLSVHLTGAQELSIDGIGNINKLDKITEGQNKLLNVLDQHS